MVRTLRQDRFGSPPKNHVDHRGPKPGLAGERVRRTGSAVVDMMDKPDGLPTSPQAQQQQQDVINTILAACSPQGWTRLLCHKVLVSCAIEVRHRKPGTKLDNRKDGRYAGRVRLAVVLDRSAESLCGFVESTVAPGSLIVTDDWSGYAGLGKRGYEHFAVAECGDPEVAEQYLPIIHLVFANLKTWLIGIHHGVSHQHLQAYLNEFTFRFNRRFYPFNAFRSLLGIAGDTSAPTYAELYSGEWRHPTCSGHGR